VVPGVHQRFDDRQGDVDLMLVPLRLTVPPTGSLTSVMVAAPPWAQSTSSSVPLRMPSSQAGCSTACRTAR